MLDTDTDIGIIAAEEGGDKLAAFGNKDAGGNILGIAGATYIDSAGASLTVWFGADGLLERAVTGAGWVFHFSNYTDTTADLTITQANGTTTFHEGVSIDATSAVRMRQLAQDGVTGTPAKLSASAKIDGEITTLSEGLEAVSLGVSWFGCVGNTIQILAGGSGIPSAITGCGGALLSTYASFTGNEIAAGAAATLSATSCAVGGVSSCVGLGLTVAQVVVDEADEDYCGGDMDEDGIGNCDDNCASVWNPDQDDACPVYTPPYMTATPIITPLGGTFTDRVEVTITCATEGAAIYYTTDGTQPNEFTSLVYLNPMTFDDYGTFTLKAVAVKAGLTSSNVTVVQFTIQGGGCEISEAEPNDEESLATSLSLCDGAGVATGMISATQGDYYDFYDLNLAIGDEVTVRVERTAGNWDSDLYDPAIRLYDGEGHYLGGSYLYPSDTEASFTTDILTISGTYHLFVHARDGSGTYRLTVSRVQHSLVYSDSEPNDDEASANMLPLPGSSVVTTGMISATQGDYYDFYDLNLAIGDEVTVRVERTAGNWDSDLYDPAIRLYDGEGHYLGGSYLYPSDTEASFTTDILTISGTYHLFVHARDGSGTYRLTVSR